MTIALQPTMSLPEIKTALQSLGPLPDCRTYLITYFETPAGAIKLKHNFRARVAHTEVHPYISSKLQQKWATEAGFHEFVQGFVDDQLETFSKVVSLRAAEQLEHDRQLSLVLAEACQFMLVMDIAQDAKYP